MLRSVKKFWWLVLLLGTLPVAWGFSLVGPVGNGGDNWQTPAIAYGLGGDIGAPKNYGEGYRRNTPVMYYAYNDNFLGFFGSNGVVAVDSAFTILNNVSNVDSYSSSLSEFPQDSQHANFLAQSLQLTDLKSAVLAAMVEQMGLADPVRYVWTLRDRRHITGAPNCPAGMEYLVVQRNFDITPNSPSIYSPYVNGVLYTYEIAESCKAPNPLSETVPISTDPFALIDTPVASDSLVQGFFYSGLTRDDVAGWRYLYTSNNIVTETAAGGSAQLITNNAPNELLTTMSLGDLIAQSKTNPPATLETNFPGLLTGDSTNFFVVQVTTNISLFYTNAPGPAITNFAPVDINSLITTLDLGLFTAQAATNNPAQLLALYTNLVIISSNAYFTNINTPNLVTTFKPVNGQPAGTFKVVITTNGFTTTYPIYYHYVFGNLFTNSFYTNSYVTIQTVTAPVPNGSPGGTLGVTNTATTTVLTHNVSGDFFIMPTNWCGFKVVQTFPTKLLISTSNTVTLSNFVSGLLTFRGTQTTTTSYTNHTFVVEPGVCEPTLTSATNYTTNIVVQYQTAFANIVTNTYFTNTAATIITTNIGACSNGVPGTVCTNITQKVVILTNVPSGDFYIPPANWCGYTILSTLLTSNIFTTNTVTAVIPANIADIGEQFSTTTISGYVNHTFLVAPLNCVAVPTTVSLREGIEHIQFVKANFDSLIGQFFQPITNNYTMVAVSNSQPVIQYLQRVVTQPDVLFSAVDRAGFGQGFELGRNINYDQANILPGLAGPGTINPPTTITFNRSAPVYLNEGTLDTNVFLNVNELTQIKEFAWGSFDFSTNVIAYPDGTSIANLENQILVQITPPPPTLPDGTNNVPYPATTFSASGGSFSPPFTWTLATGSGALPAGLTLSSGGTISGTPTNNPVGTYDVIIQLNDSLTPPRTVTWNYLINIPQ